MADFNDRIITEDFPEGWQVEDRLDSGETLLVRLTPKAFPSRTCYCLRPRATSTEDWLTTARMIARGMEVEFAKQAEANKTVWKCCGCGVPSPGRRRSCNCPTSCVYMPGNSRTALKVDPTH